MNIKWQSIKQFKDIKYEKGVKDAENINKITINRPEVRNSFRPQTVFELKEAFELAREDQSCGVVVLTGEGEKAFCAGGDIVSVYHSKNDIASNLSDNFFARFLFLGEISIFLNLIFELQIPVMTE